VLSNLQNSGGSTPNGSLIYNSATHLFYGLTNYGGSTGNGAIISFDPITGRDSLMHSFNASPDGAYPMGDLLYDTASGLYYGATFGGGTDSYGGIFSFNPITGAEHMLWSFSQYRNGRYPSQLVLYNGPEYSCPNVTVNAKSLTDTSATVIATGGTAPYFYEWSTAPPQTKDTASGLIKGTTYTVTVMDVKGCSSIATVNIPLSIDQVNSNQLIMISPNPNTGLFIVSGMTKEQSIEIYDCLGQKINMYKAGDNNKQVDISSCKNGIYFLLILNSDGSLAKSEKIIKSAY
jgi:hypothetical protein